MSEAEQTQKDPIEHNLRSIEEFLKAVMVKAIWLLDKFKELSGKIVIFVHMLEDSFAGKYKLKTDTILKILACLIYFLNPVDIVPDFMPMGFADDMAITAALFTSLKSQIDNYMEFRKGECDDTSD